MRKVELFAAAVAFALIGWFGNQVFGPKDKVREVVQMPDPAVSVGEAGQPRVTTEGQTPLVGIEWWGCRGGFGLIRRFVGCASGCRSADRFGTEGQALNASLNFCRGWLVI